MSRRRWLDLVLSGLALVILGCSTAWACTCVKQDEKQQCADAEAVFLAEVTHTALKRADASKGPPGDVIEARVDIVEYFKKPGHAIETVRGLSFLAGDCNIPLMAGMTYLFFIPARAGGPANYVGSMCSGSRPVNVYDKDFDRVLEKMRSYEPGK